MENATRYNAGFTHLTLVDCVSKLSIHGGLWYPTIDKESPVRERAFEFHVSVCGAPVLRKFPLIVLSHGTGGWFGGHYDTAEFLARHGYVVGAITHPGDNVDDRSGFGTARLLVDRPSHISFLLNYVLIDPQFSQVIDPERIGIFGFSFGGYTAIVIIGGKPGFSNINEHWTHHPHDPYAKDMAELIRTCPIPSDTLALHDPRVCAAVIMAPGLGFMFDKDALATINIPVRLYRAEHDEVLVFPSNAEHVRRMLPQEPEYIVVKGAGHYVFLAPAPGALVKAEPDIFTDRGGFNRLEFHERLNEETLEFFNRTLGSA